MKLQIQDKYWKDIESGKKKIEYRNAHLSLINIKTGETLRMEVVDVELRLREQCPDFKPEVLEDKYIIAFTLERKDSPNTPYVEGKR